MHHAVLEPGVNVDAVVDFAHRRAHGGNRVLRWHFDNIVAKQDEAGNIKPDKQKATEKIDGAVATIMALDRAVLQQNHHSVYETRGIASYGEGGFRYG